MSFFPTLRRGVTLEPGEAGGELFDPLLERRAGFGAEAWEVARRLDGSLDVEGIVAAVAPAVDRDAVEHTLRTLLALNVVEGAGDEIVRRIERLQRGEEQLGPVMLSEARFACQGSGDCCQNFALGPLRDEDIARLARLDLAAEFPALAGRAPYTTRSDRDGRFLPTVEGRCVFLEGAKCGLHARFGPEVKPAMCRLFPIEELATIEGVKLYDRGTCASFAVSARAGLPLAVELPQWIAPLLAQTPQLYHPLVVLHTGNVCDYGYFLRFQRAAVELVAKRLGGPTETLQAVGRFSRALGEAMATFPIERGEPGATVERLSAADPRRWYAGEGEASPEVVRDGLGSLAVVASDLLRVFSPSAGQDPQSTDVVVLRRARDMSHVLAALLGRAEARVLAGRGELEGSFGAEAGIPIGPEHDEVFRISLRQQLFGRRALMERRPAAGLLRLAMCYLVTRAGARMRAAEAGAAAVRTEDLSFGHTLAYRVLGQLSPEVFVAHEERAWGILSALGELD